MARGIHIKDDSSLFSRIERLDWFYIGLICMLASIGLICLYSAAHGSFYPWAIRHFIRFSLGFTVMIIIALIPVRIWFRLSWPAYAGGLLLLIAVEVMGHIGMGAQRWINLGFINLQPSEVMKVATIMVLARYYHMASPEYIKQWQSLIAPALIVAAPTILVLFQPDLGTALMLIMAAAGVVFIAGAPLWWFGLAIGTALAAMPVGWHFIHDYQKQRILTFLNPEADPLGAGYHIMQSKIALGSGGLSGKGFLEGTQSRLNFLPEKQTDFIFTLWVEEWGMLGGAALLLICAALLFIGIRIALQSKIAFSRYMALGLSINFSLYVFINIAMVMGLIPVVGVPLPLISYGGTAMLTSMIAFGLILSCQTSKSRHMNRL